MSFRPTTPRLACLCLFTATWLVAAVAPPPPGGRVIRHASDVLSLSADEAGQRLHIHVTGIVTAVESDWSGQFFVQDATAGVFVENLHRPAPAVGDVVVIDGVSHPGAFAPIISEPRWRKVGTAPLPAATPEPIQDLVAGVYDSQRVQVSGIVRTARIAGGRLQLELAVAGFRLQVFARVPPALAPAALIAAQVRVSGTAATHYLTGPRHLTSVAVYVPRVEDLEVLALEQTHPFDEPVIPINAVAQYSRGRRPECRIHVRGTVTLQRPGMDLFLQDDSGGVRVESAQSGQFRIGDQVEAAGFLEYENHLPFLRDATFRPAAARNVPVRPRVVPFGEIARGEHHGEFITLQGRILDRSSRPYTRPDGRTAGLVTTWLVQSPDITFTAEHVSAGPVPAFDAIPVNSIVAIDGVCVSTIEIGADGTAGKLTSLRLLLGAPANLHLVRQPSWFTAERLFVGVGVLSGILLVVLGWLMTMARKNAALQRVVSELERAQRELQQAHDTLEQKVAERSAQLQVEMTARKAVELQFKGGLAERTRLARDLHDTLEQTLTGIALRLKTAAKLARSDPDASDGHLQFARNCLHQSQVDLRRSIWDLRSRELEQFDLTNALRYSADQLAASSGLAVDFQTRGTPQQLPEIAEENVLRIAQEALTNVAKHAGATHVKLLVEFSPGTFRLRITDDGAGFDPAHPPADAHFGLIGMRERAKRIAAHLEITSAVGRGTTIAVEVALAPAPASGCRAGAPAVIA